MHKITFFPLGNADSFRIDLEGGKKILIDYGNERDPDDEDDKRIDLAAALREDLEEANRNDFDAVAFTHLDRDHICGSTEFFYLEHAKKYQDEKRARISVLWVPAAALLEDNLEDEAKIIQAEARFRLRNKKGIRVFSRPERLKEWIENQGMKFNDIRHLLTNAGQVVPEFTTPRDRVEFFVHSPFAEHADDGALIDRNEGSLVMQATFLADSVEAHFILSADTDHEAWTSIVKQTTLHNNGERLVWDIFKLPHHCSYLSLGPEKGKDKTEPVPKVKWLFETQGQDGSIVISTSKPIPTTDEDDQPPHRQAATYYRELMKIKNGEFKVTMQHPSESRPEPLVVEIGGSGPKVKKSAFGGASVIASRSAPRAG